ncbi:MAG: hypothetical protein ABI581_05905 [Sediminibacterium sp.]
MEKYLLAIMMLWCAGLRAQVQEIQQLKIDLEKLVQLKLMLSQAKQGYQTLQNGYNCVRDAAKGNFDLHKNYIDGLLKVSVQVKNAPALQRFMDNSALVPIEYRSWYNQLQSKGFLKTDELVLVRSRYRELENTLADELDQLQVILAPGKLRMSDGERIAAIEMLANKSDEQVGVLRKLVKEYTVIAATRAQYQKDKQAVLKLYGLH